MSGDSYSARAAQRAYDNLRLERAAEAERRRRQAEKDRDAEVERQVRAVEQEFVGASDSAERMEMLTRAARAEFDRAAAHVHRSRKSLASRALALMTVSYELLVRLYERRDAGLCLAGREWESAFTELAEIRARATAFEADLRRRSR